MRLVLALTCVLAYFQSGNGAEILAVLPMPAKSHQAVFRPVLTELAKRGHRVTFVTPLPLDKPPANLKQIVVGDVMNKIKDVMESEEGQDSWVGKGFKWIMDNWVNFLVTHVGRIVTELLLQEPQVKAIIEDTTVKYDLIILEMTFAQEALAALSHKYKAPIVEIMPTGNFHWSYILYGNPHDPNYIVEVGTSFTDHMTFCERLINTAMSLANRFYNTYYHMPKSEALANTYIRYPGWETRPPLMDIVKNASLYLMNTHLAVNYPYPLSPNVKEIGGINIQTEPKPLPKEIQDFMDEAKDGVIYFTLGSHIAVSTTLGEKLKDEFLKAFGKVKQKVLWKWEADFPNVPANVKISKWFPQQDILAHKNMKLFISHGGLLSITESVYNGVPIIGIPIMGDQPKNVAQIKATGYGIHLDFNNLTEPSISWAINEIVSNPRYKEKAMEQSRIFKDKPETALNTAVFWTEYVLRHNGAHHLRPAVSKMPWCQQALLDVYLAIAAIILIPIFITYKAMKCLCKCLCKSSSKSKPKKKRD